MISATVFHDGKPMAILKIGPGRKETDLRVVCADFFAENDIYTPCGRMNGADFTWPSAPDVHPIDTMGILATALSRLYGTRPRFDESWEILEKRMRSLDKREVEFIDREKRLEQDIENFRKSHPEERR